MLRTKQDTDLSRVIGEQQFCLMSGFVKVASCPGRVEILLATSCYGNQDKLWPDEPVLAPKASLTHNQTAEIHVASRKGVLAMQART